MRKMWEKLSLFTFFGEISVVCEKKHPVHKRIT